MPGDAQVLLLRDIGSGALAPVLEAYSLCLRSCPDHSQIPGSYWGGSEAGLIGAQVYARPDTPVHSILHESCHYVCMPAEQRINLHTNAGGDYEEENCVCFLQIVLADSVAGISRDRMFADMDAWGYSFRLGSAQAWFERDAADAAGSLRDWGVIDASRRPTWRVRGEVRSGGGPE